MVMGEPVLSTTTVRGLAAAQAAPYQAGRSLHSAIRRRSPRRRWRHLRPPPTVPRAQWHRREPVLATSVLKRDSITLEFRQSDPSSPAFFPGSDRLQDAMLVSITTAYPPVRHVDSAHLSR